MLGIVLIKIKYKKYKFLAGFTLIELLIVVVIIAVLATLAIPYLGGAVIKSRMPEMYNTFAAIRKSEEIFFNEYGFFAREHAACLPEYHLPYSINQANIDDFSRVLGIGIPGVNSVFVYGVYDYGAAAIFVRVRDNIGWGVLCYFVLQGINSGRIIANSNHPWYKYVMYDLLSAM